jgi:Concanavalin A-like lectin/glucanases superfamily
MIFALGSETKMLKKGFLSVLLAAAFLLGFQTVGRAALLAHWTFDEGSGTVVYDSGPHHYDGTLQGDAAFVSGGKSGGAVSLTHAGGGLVNLGTVLNHLAGSSYTISAWVQTSLYDPNETNVAVVTTHQWGTTAGYFLGVNTTGSGGYGAPNKAWFYNLSPSTTPYSTTTVVDGAWHQLVGVRNTSSGMISLYVDGAFQSQYPDQGLPNVPDGTPLLFGGLDHDGPTNLYTGLIDDVQFYSSALSDSQITYLYQHPGSTIPVPIPAAIYLLSSD